jgi:hypothetical protein
MKRNLNLLLKAQIYSLERVAATITIMVFLTELMTLLRKIFNLQVGLQNILKMLVMGMKKEEDGQWLKKLAQLPSQMVISNMLLHSQSKTKMKKMEKDQLLSDMLTGTLTMVF